MNKELAKLIRLAQGNRTQNQYALNCDVSSASITRICSGEYDPKPPVLEKLALHALNGVTYQDLMSAAGYITAENLPLIDRLPSNCYDAGELSYFPVIGTVAAGYEGVAVENYTGETITIPKSMLRGRPESDYFVLQVKGDSMYPRLLDGDKVLVLKVDSVDSGTVAVVLYNGCEATVKKVVYLIGEAWVKLVPENANYAPMTIAGSDLEICKILGKVVMMIRNF